MSKFAPYPEYASTSVDWLNEIPSHWRMKPLWSLFRRIKRTGYESERLLSIYRDYGVIPKDSRDDNHNRASEDLSTYQLVEPGDLAINKMKAWQGSVGISGHRGIVSPAYFIFKADHKENSRYIHHLMRCNRYIAGYQSISKGIRVNQWDLDPDKHARMPVVLPPSHEQQAIVDFLDRETARIDTLVAKKTRFIELLKEKRQAVITKAVTKGLDDSVGMKDSGVDWIGSVPSSWEVKQLKWSVLDCSNGIWGNEPDGVLDIIVVRVADFDRHHRKVRLDRPTLRSIDKSAREGRLLKRGDLLIEKSGGGDNQPVGMVVVYENEDPAVCSNFVAKMTPKEGYHSAFLNYLHQAFYGTGLHVRSIKQSTGIQNLDSKSYLDEYAAFPSLQEQKEIANWLDNSCSRIDGLIFKTERSIELLKEHRAALITAAVTGKIDVREAA